MWSLTPSTATFVRDAFAQPANGTGMPLFFLCDKSFPALQAFRMDRSRVSLPKVTHSRKTLFPLSRSGQRPKNFLMWLPVYGFRIVGTLFPDGDAPGLAVPPVQERVSAGNSLGKASPRAFATSQPTSLRIVRKRDREQRDQQASFNREMLNSDHARPNA